MAVETSLRMGTLYTVLPLDKQCADWLDSECVKHPLVGDSPRYPTPREISEELHRLADFIVSIDANAETHEWTAQVNAPAGAWAQIRIRDFRSVDLPHAFYFTKGSPEVVFIVTERLAARCGALVVVDDSNCRPVVVEEGMDPQKLTRDYVAV